MQRLFRPLYQNPIGARDGESSRCSPHSAVEPPLPILRRRIQLNFNTLPPPPWSSGWIALEALFNAASISFPPAERFGMAAVAAYRHRITNPALRQQVAGFMRQEASHAQLHATFNSALALSNPNCRRAEKIVDTMFRVLSRMPKALRLSISAGMEHIAALLGDATLRHAEDLYSMLPAPVADMWVLHAIEETEHKSVCFDVYRAGVGTGFFAGLNRVAGILIATPVFLLVMLAICSAVLRVGPSTKIASTGNDGPSRRRGTLGIIWAFIPWRRYFSYFRWTFHPWEHDNSALVKDWICRNPNFGAPTSGLV